MTMQVARLALEEAGVEYRSRAMDIGSQMEHLEPWYIRINKFAVVPTLIHKVSAALIATEPRNRAIHDNKWMKYK